MKELRRLQELIHDIYCYRQLIWALALKELKVRYKRSVLGFLWALLNPALMMLVTWSSRPSCSFPSSTMPSSY